MMTIATNTPDTSPSLASWVARRTTGLCDFWRHVRRRWLVYLALLAIWSLAFVRVFIDPTPRLPVLFNVTPSLPYTVAVVQHGHTRFKRGDFIVFSFAGEAQQHYPGLKNQPFFKVIRGVAGDRITVHDRHIYLNGMEMGWAKTHSVAGRALAPIPEMVIPPGHYYVQGTSPDSFDSRYQASGLVRADQIVAIVKPLF
ncbi:conjugative transfer signal peptidase TraF [Herbaspirillum sp. ST 5-3]|uniref:conjugative transfer signal peptidase TraF n=1 Tax=Oxalobacteraceae TaxID=75682 RepID=UPI001FFE6CAE|nr:conjugative transfer signal peptidase TraF [Herbaspirillum sp. ST 5-3]